VQTRTPRRRHPRGQLLRPLRAASFSARCASCWWKITPIRAAILSRLLRAMGHDVLHAGSVTRAIEIADREMHGGRIDLLMSDLGLPDGSGQDLMRTLSAKYALKGIALSGYGMENDLEQSNAAGFARHLTKPIDISLLRSTIADLLFS
jgi:CheY-like chemotaxis protein